MLTNKYTYNLRVILKFMYRIIIENYNNNDVIY